MRVSLKRADPRHIIVTNSKSQDGVVKGPVWFVDVVGAKATWALLKSSHCHPQSNHHPYYPPPTLALPLLSVSSHHIMNNLTDAQVAAARWTDLLEALAGLSDTTFLESIQEDLVVSAPGQVSSAGSELPIFNAVGDTAFTPAPTQSVGAYINSTNQTNYTFPVSKPLYNRRH